MSLTKVILKTNLDRITVKQTNGLRILTKRPHRKVGGFFTGDNTDQFGALQSAAAVPPSFRYCGLIDSFRCMPLLKDPFRCIQYTTAETSSVFRWAGQPQKLPLSVGRSRLHKIDGSMGPQESALVQTASRSVQPSVHSTSV